MSARTLQQHRKREHDRIPPQALAILMIVILVDLNFLEAPRTIIMLASRDAWLSVLLCIVGVFGSIGLIFYLIRCHPDKTLVEISRDVLGRYMGAVVVLLYIAFWLAAAAILVQLQSYLFARALLPNTPPFALSLYMIVVSVYLARHGIEPMARLFILLIPLFVLPLIAIGILTTTRTDPGRLLPLLEHGWKPVLTGAWTSYGAAHGIEFLLMVGPFLTTTRGALKASLVGAGTVVLAAVAVMALIVARFGVHGTVNHTWPFLSLVESVEVPGFTGFRIDPVFLSLWTALVFGSISFYIYLAATAGQRLFHLDTPLWPVLTAGAALAILSALPVNPLDVLHWVDISTPWITALFGLGFPLVLALVGRIRRLGSSVPEEEVTKR